MGYDTVTNYDEEADVLYISFYDPPLEADFSHNTGYVILRYKDEKIIGVTILNARSLCQEKVKRMDKYVALVIMKSSACMNDASSELALRDIIEKEFTDPVCKSVITEVSELIIRRVEE